MHVRCAARDQYARCSPAKQSDDQQPARGQYHGQQAHGQHHAIWYVHVANQPRFRIGDCCGLRSPNASALRPRYASTVDSGSTDRVIRQYARIK